MAMSSSQVLQVLDALEGAGVEAWLDGGWGVDALLERQTREHDDLDLVIAWDAVEDSIAALGPLGYRILKNELPCSFVLGVSPHSLEGLGPENIGESVAWTSALRVDIHPVKFDAHGAGFQAQKIGVPWRYPPEGFRGTGIVGGKAVRCLTPEVQVLCHDGYP